MQGLRIDLNINSKHSNLNPNKKQHSFKLHLGFETSKLPCSTIWSLVPRTSEMNIIRTKWVYRNKMDEHGAITRNKARLVAKG